MLTESAGAYPGSQSQLLTSPSDTSANFGNLEIDKSYYFKVCENLGGSCGVQSNEITLLVK